MGDGFSVDKLFVSVVAVLGALGDGEYHRLLSAASSKTSPPKTRLALAFFLPVDRSDVYKKLRGIN
jgi:hypothetical protein